MDLVKGCEAVLKEAKYFLQKITREQYAQKIEILSNATVGQHTRHLIEFYQCLILQEESGNINYGLRKRDSDIEMQPMAALNAIDEILKKLPLLEISKSILLQPSPDSHYGVNSTIARELLYNIEHTIHHLAFIKVGLKKVAPTLTLPENFGVASSTVQHRKVMSQEVTE